MFKSKKLKALFAVIMMITVTAVFCACSLEKFNSGKKSGEFINIGTMNLVNGDLIAQYEKWYEEELGMKARVFYFQSGKDIIAALESGTIDIGEVGNSPAARAISNGLNIRVIFIGDIIGAAETLAARNDSGVSSVKDLVGKKVATPFESTAHFSLMNSLKLEGISDKDIFLIDLDPEDILAYWQRGHIDAAYVWYPVLGKLLENGKSIINSEKLADEGIISADLFVVRSSFEEKNSGVVKKFVELQLRANDIILKEPQRAAKEISAILSISEKDAAEQITKFKYLPADEQIHYLNDSIAENLKDTADFLAKQGSIKKAASLKDFESRVTAEFVKSVSVE